MESFQLHVMDSGGRTYVHVPADVVLSTPCNGFAGGGVGVGATAQHLSTPCNGFDQQVPGGRVRIQPFNSM